MTDFIILAVIALIIGAAAFYIRKEKKRGVKCVGCPAGVECAKKHGEAGCGGCGGDSEGKCSCGGHTDTESHM